MAERPNKVRVELGLPDFKIGDAIMLTDPDDEDFRDGMLMIKAVLADSTISEEEGAEKVAQIIAENAICGMLVGRTDDTVTVDSIKRHGEYLGESSTTREFPLDRIIAVVQRRPTFLPEEEESDEEEVSE